MKNSKEKGITLSALVITIIILLILAGISIASLTGSGLFGRAKDAKQKSENGQEKENITLSEYENELDKYMSGTETGEIVVTAPETYVKSFNAGENGDNIIGYIVVNSDDSSAYDLIFVGTGKMADRYTLSNEMSDYVSFNSMASEFEKITVWKANFINIKFSNGITNIPAWVFNNSSTIKNIDIPNTVTNIGEGTFSGNNTAIKNITIPASVTNMGGYIFQGWTSSSTITIKGSTDGWDSSWNSDCQAQIIKK